MKKMFIIMILMLTFFMHAKSEEGWYLQTSCLKEYHMSINFVDKLTGWATTGSGQIIHTKDGGYNWYKQLDMNKPGLTIFDIFCLDNKYAWASDIDSYVYRTTDGGLNWERKIINYSNLSKLFFIDSLHGWNAGRYGYIQYSEDGGISWSIQDSSTKNILNGIFFIDRLTGFVVGKYGTFLKTSDGGINWRQIDLGMNKKDLFQVYFSDTLNGWIIGKYGLVLHTSDGGEHWDKQISNVDTDLVDLHFINSNKGWVVGFNGTILYTSDGGKNWTKQNSGVTWNLLSVSFVDSTNGWACGLNDKILHTTDGGITFVEIVKPPQGNLKIIPNPASDQTEIFFNIPIFSNISISVCDNLGNQVCSEILKEQQLGDFKYQLDTKALPSGIYYISINYGFNVLKEKLLILK